MIRRGKERIVRGTLISNLKIIKMLLKFILRGETGVYKKSALASPLGKSSIIEHLHFFIDDKRNDIVAETLLEDDQSAYAPVSVLKRMYALKSIMKIKNFFKGFVFLFVIAGEQRSHFI